MQSDVPLILDNNGTHKTALIRRWLLKRPRFHVHVTPTSASWLNRVERWFALLTEKQLRRGVHRSTQALQAAIRAFITHTNKRYLTAPLALLPDPSRDGSLEMEASYRNRARIHPGVSV